MLGIFGNIRNPFLDVAPSATDYHTDTGSGLIVLMTSLIQLSVVIAGLYTLINIIMAGYGYLSANGDQKAVQKSHEKIYRSFMGLAIVAGSLLLAALMGFFIYGASNWNAIVSPRIYRP